MTLADFRAELERIKQEGLDAIGVAASAGALEDVRVALVGRRSGRFTALMKQLPALAAEDRPGAGALVNAVKEEFELALSARDGELARTRTDAPALDLTLPARRAWRGSRHPVTIVMDEIEEIFRELGFAIALGPEAESDWYNFTALNFPLDHPALDMHDTLYLDEHLVLRTHTSPVQVRTLQRFEPPVRVLVPGNVYRRDFFDASHAPMFAQVEGLAVDEGISFADLKATLTHFATRFFGATRTRFRPSYFPFTEPSAEMDVECQLCHGSGCGACKHTGWMEILGSGMVHPSVIEAAGLDSERYTGFAFGMGPARIAMVRWALPDIRLLYDSDVRFLARFADGGAA